MDWLRVFGIVLLFPFHTARVFDHWEPNYIKDSPNWFSSWFVLGTAFWFMPLMFLVAGFSCCHALHRRTAGEYMRERVSRLLIPLLAGTVLIVPIQGYVARIQQFAYTGTYLSFLGSCFTDFSDLSGYRGTFTPGHLWFLLYLFAISVCLLPVLRRINAIEQHRLENLKKPALVLFAFIPLTIMEALPGVGGKNPFYYAAFFLLGYLIARVEGLLDALRVFRFKTLLAVAVAVPAFLLFGVSFGWPSGFTAPAIVAALLRNLAAWLVLVTLLGFADMHLNKPSSALNTLNRAAFPVYVLHQSVMMVVAFFVVAWNIPAALKFTLILCATLALSLLGFELSRRFKITRLMLGIK